MWAKEINLVLVVGFTKTFKSIALYIAATTQMLEWLCLRYLLRF